MKILIESSFVLTYPITEMFSILTSNAVINIKDINHDIERKIVKVYLKRKEIIRRDRRSLFDFWKPIYDYGPKWIDSVLTIRHVSEIKMLIDEKLINECDSRFTLMMGIGFGKNFIELNSIEETRGITLCQIKIFVTEYDLELGDSANTLN